MMITGLVIGGIQNNKLLDQESSRLSVKMRGVQVSAIMIYETLPPLYINLNLRVKK